MLRLASLCRHHPPASSGRRAGVKRGLCDQPRTPSTSADLGLGLPHRAGASPPRHRAEAPCVLREEVLPGAFVPVRGSSVYSLAAFVQTWPPEHPPPHVEVVLALTEWQCFSQQVRESAWGLEKTDTLLCSPVFLGLARASRKLWNQEHFPGCSFLWKVTCVGSPLGNWGKHTGGPFPGLGATQSCLLQHRVTEQG